MYTILLVREWKWGGVDIYGFASCVFWFGFYTSVSVLMTLFERRHESINGVKSILTRQQGKIVFSEIIGEGNEK